MYWVMLDEDDRKFLRIALPNFWRIADDESRARVERAALETSTELKLVKVFPIGGDTWATIELLSSSIENTKQILPRAIRTWAVAARIFRQKMLG